MTGHDLTACLVAAAAESRRSPLSLSISAVQPLREEELLAEVLAQLIGDDLGVAVGNASPILATAALVARARGEGGPMCH
jgi:hypothetical protein